MFAELYEAAVVSAVYTDSDEFLDTEEAIGVEECHWNPFHWYYREPDIFRMAEDNRLLTGVDPWEPDEGEVGSMRFSFAVIKAMTDKLRGWISGNDNV